MACGSNEDDELVEKENAFGASNTGSDEAMVDEVIPLDLHTVPSITNLHVSKFSKVQIGNRLIIQHIHSCNEKNKDRSLTLKSLLLVKSRFRHCFSAVVCCAFFFAPGTLIYLLSIALTKPVCLDTDNSFDTITRTITGFPKRFLQVMWNEGEQHDMQVYNALMDRFEVGCKIMARQTVPNITNLNVSKFSKVHIGDKINILNTYYGHVNQIAVVNDQKLNLKSILPIRSNLKSIFPIKTCNRCCRISVMMSSVLLVTLGLAYVFLLCYVTEMKYHLDTGLNETWYLRREDWQHINSYTRVYLRFLPVQSILVGHSGRQFCDDRHSCTREVLDLQKEYDRRGWPDIGPSYLIGGNGLVFEGRGINIWGDMLNPHGCGNCILVMFLGDYERDQIVKEQFDHLEILLKKLANNKIGVHNPVPVMWSDSENDMQEYNALLSRPSAYPEIRAAPDITNLHVKKFSKVHIGDKYVTQNIYNAKFVRGSRLGLKPERPTLKPRTTRCSVTIFVNAVFFATSSLAIYLVFLTFAKEPVRLDIDLNETWYQTRADWQAIPPDTFELLRLPVKYVILGYSYEKDCTDIYSCRNIIWDKQINAMLKDSEDIGPNYLISFNGFVFEGRGANVIGSMTKSYDRKSISVMFFGLCESNIIDAETFDHLDILLKQLERLKVLDQDYSIFRYCQSHITDRPGCDFNTALEKTFTLFCQSKNHDGRRIIFPTTCYNRSALFSGRQYLNESPWCFETVKQIKNKAQAQLIKNLNRNKK
ncbi:hypothetical protein K1T71_012450 [Dendrolimus kikuchii]|uniref:Uncharacterized protein n=1 Tax=Dendrolimus kikuchii TaxID=765133 RepID=A0ACC1CJL3_9NEOP|nr:hypothetical protein K1T71_012450 [Dendrolimus kikuchii]